MALSDVDRVLGPQQLIGSDQPHVLLHHQVLDDACGRQRVAVPTVDQDALPLLRGGVDALVDVLETALLQRRAIAQSVRHISDVHFEAGPAVASATRAGAGYEAKGGGRFSWSTAHVDDAIDVVAAQRTAIVRCV